MAYRITYKRSVTGDLKHLDRLARQRILDKIDAELTRDPIRYPSLKGHYASLRRMRVGDYRVICTVLDEEVLILRTGHRREVYR